MSSSWEQDERLAGSGKQRSALERLDVSLRAVGGLLNDGWITTATLPIAVRSQTAKFARSKTCPRKALNVRSCQKRTFGAGPTDNEFVPTSAVPAPRLVAFHTVSAKLDLGVDLT